MLYADDLHSFRFYDVRRLCAYRIRGVFSPARLVQGYLTVTAALFSLPSIRRPAPPNHWDALAFALVIGFITMIAHAHKGMDIPFDVGKTQLPISLDPINLPEYALRTSLRMGVALAASLIFSLVYAAPAAKSRMMERLLIPGSRHPAVGADFELSDHYGHRLHGLYFRAASWGSEPASIFASVHLAGVEHHLQPLPVIPHRALGPGRSLAHVPGFGVAQVLGAGSAVRHAATGMEPDDVRRGRLVFCGRQSEAITVLRTRQVTACRASVPISRRRSRPGIFAAVRLCLLIAMLTVIIMAVDQLVMRPLLVWSGQIPPIRRSRAKTSRESWFFNMLPPRAISESSGCHLDAATQIRWKIDEASERRASSTGASYGNRPVYRTELPSPLSRCARRVRSISHGTY